MDKHKQKAIEKHNAALMDSMDPVAVMDYLSTDLLSLADKEFIKESHSTRRYRNRELISILFKKREELEPFERFVKALNETDKSHAAMAEAILKIYDQTKMPTNSASANNGKCATPEAPRVRTADNDNISSNGNDPVLTEESPLIPSMPTSQINDQVPSQPPTSHGDTQALLEEEEHRNCITEQCQRNKALMCYVVFIFLLTAIFIVILAVFFLLEKDRAAPDYHSTSLLIAQDNKIFKKSISSTSSIEEIVAMNYSQIYDITFDCKQERIVWSASNGIEKRNEIWTALLDGTDRKLICTMKGNFIQSIALDWSSRNIYYNIYSGKIGVFNLIGNFTKTLIETDKLTYEYNSHLALDLKNRYLFYSSPSRIWRVGLDGLNRTEFASSFVEYPTALVILNKRRELCWLDAMRKELSCIGLDQRNRRVVYDNIPMSPLSSLTAHNEERFYWTTSNEKIVHTVSIFGEYFTTFEVQKEGLLYAVSDTIESGLQVETECAVNNGGCPYLCLPKTGGGVSCVTPDIIDNLIP
uniref:CARD domain-containing protein n=1 Tax=Plectus sambesii TaxID=2011161 RepID=A0A914WT52_9BILA